mgnify:CR=1 FL=1
MQTGIVCTVLSEMEIRMEQLAIFGGKPVRKTPISYGHQYIDDADIEAVANVLRSEGDRAGEAFVRSNRGKLCRYGQQRNGGAASGCDGGGHYERG